MFLITLVFTSVVSAVKLLNEERIQINQKIKLQGIVLQVLGMRPDEHLSGEALMKIFQDRIRPVEVKERTLYIGYEADGKTVQGYAFPVGGAGFWGPIYGMVAVDPQASEIMGVAFYKHSETPGLGGRITEKWFVEQFVGLKLHPVEGDKKIFYLRTEGTGKASNELDAITGATGTSRGIESFMNQELDYFLTALWGSMKRG
jgi:Na+-transporting NADH:ubiquinone oxidoreductase subunit C